MGVRWIRTARIANGKFKETVSWGKEIAAFCETKFGTGRITTYVDTFGQIGTIRWMVDYTDLAALEKAQTAMMADQDYWKLVQKAWSAGLLVEASTEDVVCRVV